MISYKLPYHPVKDLALTQQWLCDLIEDRYKLVSEPINIQIVDEDSRRLTVYYGQEGTGMPIGWILPGYEYFQFGIIFDAVARYEGDD